MQLNFKLFSLRKFLLGLGKWPLWKINLSTEAVVGSIASICSEKSATKPLFVFIPKFESTVII